MRWVIMIHLDNSHPTLLTAWLQVKVLVSLVVSVLEVPYPYLTVEEHT